MVHRLSVKSHDKKHEEQREKEGPPHPIVTAPELCEGEMPLSTEDMLATFLNFSAAFSY